MKRILLIIALAGCASAPPPHVVKPTLAWESRDHADEIAAAEFSPDSRWLVTAHSNGRFRMFSPERAKEVASFGDEAAGRVELRGMRFTPDGAGLITLHDHMKNERSDGGTLRRWHLGGGALQWSKDEDDALEWFELTPDGKRILLQRLDDFWALHDAATGELLRLAADREELLGARAVRAVLAPQRGRMGVSLIARDASGKELARVEGPFEPRSLVVSPDGATLVVRTESRSNPETVLFDAATLKERGRFRAGQPTFAPDGHLLIDCDGETLVVLPAMAAPIATIPMSIGQFAVFGWRWVAVEEGKLVRVFDLTDGREVARLEHPSSFRPVKFLRDGRLVTASRSVHEPSGSEVGAAKDFSKKFPAFAIRYASDDPHSIRIWDVAEGREVVRYEEKWGVTLFISPDQTHLAWLSGHPGRKLWLAPIP